MGKDTRHALPGWYTNKARQYRREMQDGMRQQRQMHGNWLSSTYVT